MASRGYIAAELLNAGLFTANVGLVAGCIYRLLSDKAAARHSSTRRKSLLGYVVLTAGLSFYAIVYDAERFIDFSLYLTRALIYGNEKLHYIEPEYDTLRPPLAFSLWSAVLFMIWRLAYTFVRPTEKGTAFLLGCLATTLVSISLVFGQKAITFDKASTLYDEFLYDYCFFSIPTAAVNVIISVAIAARLIFWEKVLDGIAPIWTVAFLKALLQILVSSGALLTLLAVQAACFFKQGVDDWMDIPLFIMPQICAMSTLLIVYDISERVEERLVRLPDSPEIAPVEVQCV